jgi:7-cyano-7-deazaguanine synthase
MNQPPGVTGPRVVPARNLILIAHAVNHAAVQGLDEVWYGACADDLRDYADCRPEFVFELCKITDETESVEVRAPLLHMTKSEIFSKAEAYGINREEAWSCYAPKNDKPCGKCNSCELRGKR